MLLDKKLLKYYKKYWYFYLVGIIALLVVDICDGVYPPKIIKEIIDALDQNTMTEEFLLDSCFKLAMLMLANFVSRILWRLGFFFTQHRVGRDFRHELFKKSLTFSQTFYNDNKVGGLMSYYINDVDSVAECFGWGLMMTFDTLFLIPIILVQMFIESWQIALILLVPLIIIAVAALIFGKGMEERYDKRQQAFENLSDFTQESISGIRVVKAFVKEAKEFKDFSKKNKENEEANIKYLRLSVLFNNAIDLFIWALYFVIVAIGSYLVLNGGESAITPGTLTELVTYFDKLLWPMFAIGEIINIRSRGKASFKRLEEYLEKDTDLIDAKEPIECSELKGDIEFRHLYFRYPTSDHNQITDMTLKIKAGEFIGIIGRTGSSKSTLASLLLRLYNINEGQIYLDGKDIMDYKVEDVRRNIGYVPQDNFLYSTTIEENIGFIDRTPNHDEVIRCATIAGVNKDIEDFPLKYETILGERGVSVSGGQKQRISIARALYKNASILILDDSLSAVDTKTEEEILEFLKKERKGKTTILIAHRISSIIDADKIMVLDRGGKVTGFDTHNNLLESNEIYKETYNLQKLEKEGGVDHA